jgi:hypothetical protein
MELLSCMKIKKIIGSRNFFSLKNDVVSLWENCKDTYRRWLRVEVDSLIFNEMFEPEKTISYASRGFILLRARS